MTRIRTTLTTALAVLALGALNAGCARGNAGLSFDPNRPMMQTAGYVPAEEPDDEVADVLWDSCDGECRYRESMRICSTTIQVAGAQRQHAHAAFMQFRDRTTFRARVMQSCAGGRVQYAGHSRSGVSRGTPICPTGQTFRPQYGKCVGGVLHDVPLSEERRQYYVGCPKIETRLVVRGGRLEKQQRCAPQETRARS